MSDKTIGRYQILGEIGRGSMATVYRAFDPNSNREVAIKILPREMMHNPDFRARFMREITMISSLEHPSIVPVYDSGEDNGQLYFVMRYMTGGSLTDLLKRGKLSPRRTAEIIERVALGLDYAHQKGIIHRDIKPDNVLFDTSGKPYLSDFGVAKLAEVAISDTGSGVMGTPAYLSPEQASGNNNEVDNRSDVYGLGVLIYQMLTGERPFTADTSLGVLVKHINEPVPNIRDVNPSLPPWFETVIKIAMAKKKEDRYHSVLEFSHAVSIAAFGSERTVPSALILERNRRTNSERRRRFVTLGGAILLAILAGIYFPLSKPAQLPIPTDTATIIPSVILPSVTAEAPIPTITITPTQEVPTLVPTPNGGADLIVLLSGNEIISMNLDGNRPEPVDTINIEKANLQWINNGLLIYISPTRNCAYVIDVEEKETNEVICFRLDEKLEGFRISSDGKYVAIGVARTLHIVPFDMEFFESINTRYTRFLLENIENGCHYDLPVKDVRWSDDGRRIAALVVDTQQANSDQIHLFEVDLLDCNSRVLIPTDKFPANRFSFASTTIPSYDWDGKHYFLINDFIRNNGFGNLYLYNSENHKEEIINPINGACCYRDARWSPDGEYILFLYQNEFESEVMLYYIPTSALDTDEMLTPIEIPPGLLKSRDKPQPVLIPAQ